MAGFAVLAAIVIVPTLGKKREICTRSVESSNLRQIGQASLIYASEHQDRLPVSSDIWAYAGELAREGGLNDATIWYAGIDPANLTGRANVTTVLASDRRELEAKFKSLIPSWAVPLGGITANMPVTTPIAWTRGLKTDGTWSTHSPYGAVGGHVVFLGGNVAFYRNTKDAFFRFDGKGMTSNILEALPPGTRIGEYVPNDAEQREWESVSRKHSIRTTVKELTWPAIWLVSFVVLLVQCIRRRLPWSLFFWFLAMSTLIAVILPTVGKVR